MPGICALWAADRRHVQQRFLLDRGSVGKEGGCFPGPFHFTPLRQGLRYYRLTWNSLIFLLLSLQYWDYRLVPPRLDYPILGIKPRALNMLGRHFPADLHSQPRTAFYFCVFICETHHSLTGLSLTPFFFQLTLARLVCFPCKVKVKCLVRVTFGLCPT